MDKETNLGELRGYAWLSIGTAVATIALKALAYGLTGSVGLLSDALESGVNLATAVLALIILSIAQQPPDEEHAYGHSKAEYFSGGVEGSLIVIASITIVGAALRSLFLPTDLQQIDMGLVVSLVAAVCNGVTAVILRRAAQKHHSITLSANARHLLADVWTTFGVIVGVGLVALTGWFWLDPLIAIGVALHILYSGSKLVHEAIEGLMDTALPDMELAKVVAVLESHSNEHIQYHALRTRRSGRQRFISVHIQVPGAWSVQEGHTLLEEIEYELRCAVPVASVLTHLEPLEDPVSWQDIPLNRPI